MNTLNTRPWVQSDDAANGDGRKLEGYEVLGLPTGHQAWIVRRADKWHLMRGVQGGFYSWMGEYCSVKDALRALADDQLEST